MGSAIVFNNGNVSVSNKNKTATATATQASVVKKAPTKKIASTKGKTSTTMMSQLRSLYHEGATLTSKKLASMLKVPEAYILDNGLFGRQLRRLKAEKIYIEVETLKNGKKVFHF